MQRTLLALAITGLFTLPAFAQTSGMSPATMTCAEFTAMDSASQMAAVESMNDMMSGDAMASGDQMSSDNTMTSGGSAASDDNAMASGDAMASEEMTAQGAASACAAHPDMSVQDAMGAMN